MCKVDSRERTARDDRAFGSTGAALAVNLDDDAGPAALGPWWDNEPSPAELSRMFRAAPAMPSVDRSNEGQQASEQPRRDKLPYCAQIHREMHDTLWDGETHLSHVAAVARSVNKKEAASNPKAQ